MKLLFYNKQLYSVVREKATLFKVRKYHMMCSHCVDYIINLRAETMEDYTLISCFQLLGDTPIEKIERNSKKYVIITDLNIDNQHVLFRKRGDSLFYQKVKDEDVFPIHKTEQMSHIVDNYISAMTEYRNFRVDRVVPDRRLIMFNSRGQIRDISSMTHEDMLVDMIERWRYQYMNELTKIAHHPLRNEIMKLLEECLPLDYIEDLMEEHDDMMDEYDERINNNKVDPLLSQEQIERIMQLKKQLPEDKDPHRRSWQYTTKELGVATLILSNCNNNKESYLLGLRQIFSKPRAEAILRKIVS